MANCKHCSTDFQPKRTTQVFCNPQCKKDYWKDPVLQRVYQQTHKIARPERRLWKAAKDRANKYGLPFNITVEDVVIPEFCPVLGIKLQDGIGKGKGANPESPSLDRVVPSLGYVRGNVRVISFKANSMKRDASEEELLMFAGWIIETHGRVQH